MKNREAVSEKLYAAILLELAGRYDTYIGECYVARVYFPRWKTFFWSIKKLRAKGLEVWDEYMPDVRRLLISHGYEVIRVKCIPTRRIINVKRKEE